MRGFIALFPSKETLDYLYQLQKDLKNELPAKLNWIPKSKIHLTLRFLGEIDQNNVEKIKERLKTIKFKSFSLKLNELGFFPHEDAIRVLWIGLIPEKIIRDLERKLDEELLDLSSRDQEFKAHLTLGRVKEIKDKEKFIEKIKEIKIKKLSFEIKDFKFIESELTKDGPKYRVLEEYILD